MHMAAGSDISICQHTAAHGSHINIRACRYFAVNSHVIICIKFHIFLLCLDRIMEGGISLGCGLYMVIHLHGTIDRNRTGGFDVQVVQPGDIAHRTFDMGISGFDVQRSMIQVSLYHIVGHFGAGLIVIDIIPLGIQQVFTLVALVGIIVQSQSRLTVIAIIVIRLAGSKIGVVLTAKSILQGIAMRLALPFSIILFVITFNDFAHSLHVEDGAFLLALCPGPETGMAAILQIVPAAFIALNVFGSALQGRYLTLLQHRGSAQHTLSVHGNKLAIGIHRIVFAIICFRHSYCHHMAANKGLGSIREVRIDSGGGNCILQSPCNHGQM